MLALDWLRQKGARTLPPSGCRCDGPSLRNRTEDRKPGASREVCLPSLRQPDLRQPCPSLRWGRPLQCSGHGSPRTEQSCSGFVSPSSQDRRTYGPRNPRGVLRWGRFDERPCGTLRYHSDHRSEGCYGGTLGARWGSHYEPAVGSASKISRSRRTRDRRSIRSWWDYQEGSRSGARNQPGHDHQHLAEASPPVAGRREGVRACWQPRTAGPHFHPPKPPEAAAASALRRSISS